MFQPRWDVGTNPQKKRLTFGRASHAWAIDRSAAPWVSLWISTSMTSPTSGVLMTDQRSTFLWLLRYFSNKICWGQAQHISRLQDFTRSLEKPNGHNDGIEHVEKIWNNKHLEKRNIRTEGELLFAAPTSLFCKYQGLARSKTPCWVFGLWGRAMEKTQGL